MRTEDVVLTKGQKFKVAFLVIRDMLVTTFKFLLCFWFASIPMLATCIYLCSISMVDKEGPLSIPERLLVTAFFMGCAGAVGAFVHWACSELWHTFRNAFEEQFAVYEAEEKERTIKEGVDKVILDE